MIESILHHFQTHCCENLYFNDILEFYNKNLSTHFSLSSHIYLSNGNKTLFVNPFLHFGEWTSSYILQIYKAYFNLKSIFRLYRLYRLLLCMSKYSFEIIFLLCWRIFFLAEENAILMDRKNTHIERWINFRRDDYTLLAFFLKAKIFKTIKRKPTALCFTQYWNKLRNYFVNDMLIIYFIQEENHKNDKQKRPILFVRKQNRRFFRDIKNTYFFFRTLNFFARTAFFTLKHIQKV